MARVPSAPSGVAPTLGSTVFQNIQATPDAFGAAQGRALQTAGEAGQQLGGQIVEQERLNQIRDNNRENQLAQIRLNEEYAVIEQEYKTLKGEDAVRRLDEFSVRIAETRDTIADSMSNKVTAEMFDIGSASADLGTNSRMGNHQSIERDSADDAADAAAVKEANDRAKLANEDLDEVDLAIEQARAAIEHSAERAGLGEDVVKSKGEEGASTTALGAIKSALANSNIVQAETLFARYTFAENGDTPILEGDDRDAALIAIRNALGTRLHKRTAEARDIITAIDNGDVVRTPQEIEDIVQDLRAGGTDSEIDAANDLERKAAAQDRTNVVLTTTTLSDQERFLEELGAIKGPITIEQSVVKEYYEKQVALGRKARTDGNLIDLYSQRYNLSKPPLNSHAFHTNPEALSERNFFAKQASSPAPDGLGEPVSPLNKQEVEELEKVLSGEADSQGTIHTAQQAADAMANIHSAFGERQAGAIASRMTEENRAVALALIKSVDDPSLAAKIIRGGRLRKDPALKATLGTATTRNIAFDEVLGGMESGPSGIRSTILAAAEGHYLQTNPNIVEFDEELFKESIAAVVGGVVEQEGNSIPTYAPGVSQERFDFVLSKLTADMFPDGSFFIENDDGEAVEYNIELLDQSFFNPADNPQLRPKGLGGKYTIQMPDGRFILDGAGNAAIIDLRRIDAEVGERPISFQDQGGIVGRRLSRAEFFRTKGEIPFEELRARVTNVQTQPNVATPGNAPSPFATKEDLSDLNITSDTTIEGRTFLNQSLSQLFGDVSKQQVITERLKLQENSQRKGRNTNGIWKQHLDPLGLPTIGYGHFFTSEEKSSGIIEIDSVQVNWKTDGLTDAQVETMLQQDVALHGEVASRAVSNWSNLNNARKAVILDMAFGLGESRLDKFHNPTRTGTLDLIELGKFIEAAQKILNNPRFFSASRRLELAKMLETGRF